MQSNPPVPACRFRVLVSSLYTLTRRISISAGRQLAPRRWRVACPSPRQAGAPLRGRTGLHCDFRLITFSGMIGGGVFQGRMWIPGGGIYLPTAGLAEHKSLAGVRRCRICVHRRLSAVALSFVAIGTMSRMALNYHRLEASGFVPRFHGSSLCVMMTQARSLVGSKPTFRIRTARTSSGLRLSSRGRASVPILPQTFGHPILRLQGEGFPPCY